MPVLSALLLAVAVVCLAAAASAWPRRRGVGGSAVLVLLLAAAEWNAGYALEIAVTDPATKLVWAKAQYVGIVVAPLGFFAFAMAYTGRTRWTRRRPLSLLALPPLVTLLLTATNDVHHLVWATVDVPPGGVGPLVLGHGPGFFPHWIYSYLLLGVASVALVAQQASLHRFHRRQSWAVICAVAVPWVCNGVYVVAKAPLDLTTIGFAVTAVLLWAACGRWGLLVTPPVARSLVVEHMRDGMVVLDAAGVVVDVNRAALPGLTCELDQAVGRAATAVLASPLQAALGSAGQPAVVALSTPDGLRSYELDRVELPAAHGRSGQVLLLRDVTERELLHAHLSAAASSDPLTGIGNRRLLVARLHTALAASASSGRPLAVLLIDLDDFKPVNDTFGHAVGDEVLITTAARLSSAVRPGDCVARLGGDEFAVLLGDVADEQEAWTFVRRVTATLQEPLSVAGRSLTLRASVGLHVAVAEGQTPHSLLQAADFAMYRAKKASRDGSSPMAVPQQRASRADAPAVTSSVTDTSARQPF